MIRINSIVFLLIISFSANGQITGGHISGNFLADFQFYMPDEKLGVTDSSLAGKRTGMNAYANLLYSSNNLEAGIRYETYLPPLAGYDLRFEGSGVANRYLRFFDDEWDITVGNYYEQFGSGLVFRSYQDWALGFDNSMDGLRLRYRPVNGVYLKMITGVQRYYWDRWSRDDDRGIVSGFDAEVNLNETFKIFSESKTRLIIGGSFVSKNQKDNDPIYKIPQNVASFAGRFMLNRGNINIQGEYAYKINDPSADNNYIYKPGEALFLQMAYAVRGFSFSIGGKRLDNMSYRSDRNAGLNDLMINYLPALNMQHNYALPAIYPYATQTNGELGFTSIIGYNIKRGSKLGGRYGTDISVAYSRITDIKRDQIDDITPVGQRGTMGYTSDFLKEGDRFFEDISVELRRRISRELRVTLLYAWIFYNIEVIEGHTGDEDVVSNSFVADISYRIKPRQAIRLECQHLSTDKDNGSWASAVVEYTHKGFFIGLQDVWNYGNSEPDKRLHYILVSAGFTKKATRVAVSYGRQKEGIVCVGGVCRFLPAVSGFSLSITTSF